jgi:hypothetical protein
MDHTEATATFATDRYLLGELSDAQADAFEEHYFDCAECTDDLRAGMQLLSGGRMLTHEGALAPEALAPEAAPAPVVRIADRRRRAWLPAAIAAALALAVTAPIIVKQQRDAHAPVFEAASQSYRLSAPRGPNDILTLDGNKPTVLWVDPSEPTYAQYEARLKRPDGSVMKVPFTPDPDGNPTPLMVRGLSPGPHELVVIGTDPAGQIAEISRNRFNVRR